MHWSGKPPRMNRKSLENDDDLAKLHVLEELIAEIGSVGLIRYFGICDHFPEASLIYIKKHLDDLPSELQKYYFTRANSGAREAVKYMVERFEKTRKKK